MDSRRKGRSGSGRGRWRDRRARAIDLVRGVLGHRVGPAPRTLKLTVRGQKRLGELREVYLGMTVEGEAHYVFLKRVTDAEEDRDGLS